MKPESDPAAVAQFQRSVAKIVDLYQDVPVQVVLNDLVAIGTWPTPERPQPQPVSVTSPRPVHGSVAIDTVPLPERPMILKASLVDLFAIVGQEPLGTLVNPKRR